MSFPLCSALFLCAVATAAPPRDSIPKLDTAQAELDRADGLRTAMRGKDGDARTAARKSAVEAYRAAREHWSTEAKVCAEASFRAGELLRSANEAGAALAEFQVARERGKDSPYRVRAALEVGHIHRRAREHDQALAAYESVISDPAATPGQRDDASYWEGNVYAAAKRLDDARRAWQRVADGGEDPLDRIRAWDEIAGSYVDAGDLEAAAGALEKCREANAEAAAEETKLGDRVRRALASMRSNDDLQRTVEKRDGKKSERKLP